ncbi:MAG: ankyrin repeat domain-containing protein [Proteobacteria bacterium]|nr:ankyrin repeat domain-containing protein [Pseudomonadota bacterium]MBU1741634.1 ankyrin repeat domain-containing protein [Pseudomonadota bacterium]
MEPIANHQSSPAVPSPRQSRRRFARPGLAWGTMLLAFWAVTPVWAQAAKPAIQEGRAFLAAAGRGDLARVKAMVARDPGLVNYKTKTGYTALHQTALSGHVAVARYLLDQGAALEARDKYGFTPLHQAAHRHAKITVTRLLIERGAKVNAPDIKGHTPLFRAILNGRPDIAALLKKSGGRLPADAAARFFVAVAQNDPNLAARIAARDPKVVQARTAVGATPLHVAAMLGRSRTTAWLIKQGADLNAVNVSKMTPLALAVLLHQPDTAALLIQNKAKLDPTDTLGRTPLHLAAIKGYTEVAARLIKAGANVRARDRWGHTPLHSAAYWGRDRIVPLLIARGAPLNLRDQFGLTPLAWALRRRKMSTARLLRQKGAQQ